MFSNAIISLMNLRFIDSGLIEQTAQKVGELVGQYGLDEQISLFVSGGSALVVLEKMDEGVLGDNLSIMMIDERYDQDSQVNNFSQLKETNFFKQAIKGGVKFVDTSVLLGEDFGQYGLRFAEEVNRLAKNKVVVLLGLGEDGHTAGIMPFADEPNKFAELFEGDDLAVGYDASGKNPYPLRVTVTNTFLRNQVEAGVVFISGQKKKEALISVLQSSEDMSMIPGRIFHYIPQLSIFTDIASLEDLNI